MNPRLLLITNWEELARQAGYQPGKMATLCSISLRQMERFFAEHFHQSPGHWARDLQCRLAKELIQKGFSSKAVATEMKFAHESHFCHEFKKCYGVSPQTYAPQPRASR